MKIDSFIGKCLINAEAVFKTHFKCCLMLKSKKIVLLKSFIVSNYAHQFKHIFDKLAV